MRLGDRRQICFVWVFATCVAAEPETADQSESRKTPTDQSELMKTPTSTFWNWSEFTHHPTNILPLAHDSCWQGFNNWTFQSLFESSVREQSEDERGQKIWISGGQIRSSAFDQGTGQWLDKSPMCLIKTENSCLLSWWLSGCHDHWGRQWSRW